MPSMTGEVCEYVGVLLYGSKMVIRLANLLTALLALRVPETWSRAPFVFQEYQDGSLNIDKMKGM